MIVPRIETQFRVSPRAPHLQLALSRRVIAPMLLSLLPGSQKKQEAREIPRDQVRKCVWCWAEEPHRSVAASQMLLPPPYVVAGHDFSTFQNLRGDEAASQSPHSCVPEPQGSSDEIRPSPSQQANEKTYLVPPATSSTPFGALTLISGLPLGILVTAPPSHLHLVPPGPSPEDGHHFLSLKSESAFLLLSAVSVTSVNS
ncbi:hypothetical protein CCUS01_05163 [Colletotrichum cuscutae]|uniref:Uncharacterized protein n=1 Tax=Colletotrichum cuscutae TaxID=1209917 RepID=A0AAI9Y2U4_9PEZI|nr:hypothetical protein CCUS01_05163 [Colletotrichum cuscutae]